MHHLPHQEDPGPFVSLRLLTLFIYLLLLPAPMYIIDPMHHLPQQEGPDLFVSLRPLVRLRLIHSTNSSGWAAYLPLVCFYSAVSFTVIQVKKIDSALRSAFWDLPNYSAADTILTHVIFTSVSIGRSSTS
jgi:hypothetical protein